MSREGDSCPECAFGWLQRRNGRNGPFLGCSRYPKCKYSCDIEPEEADPCTPDLFGRVFPMPPEEDIPDVVKMSDIVLYELLDRILTEMGDRGLDPEEPYRSSNEDLAKDNGIGSNRRCDRPLDSSSHEIQGPGDPGGHKGIDELPFP